MKYDALKQIFQEYEKGNPKTNLTAYIRLKNYGPLNYDARSRTYIVSSGCPFFQQKSGNELCGSALDGTCEEMRLDDLIQEETADAPTSVEECSIMLYELICRDCNENVTERRSFIGFAQAKETMLVSMAEKAGEDADEILKNHILNKPVYKGGVYIAEESSAKAVDRSGHAWSWEISDILIPSEEFFKEKLKQISRENQ